LKRFSPGIIPRVPCGSSACLPVATRYPRSPRHSRPPRAGAGHSSAHTGADPQATARTRPPLPEFPRSCWKMGPRRQSTSMSVGPASNCPGESWAARAGTAPHGSSVARVSTSCAGRRATATSLRGLHGIVSLYMRDVYNHSKSNNWQWQ
jgi:hypothetical protein